MSKKVRAVVSEKTIVIHYDGKPLNINKDTDALLYEEFKKLIEAGDETLIIKRYINIKALVEDFTNDMITVEKGEAFLKGSNVPVPKMIIKKLIELEKEGESFLPLIRFWKKLSENPSANSREQLYGFMISNNIPLTETGDIVVEKGVSQKRNGIPGELVDGHSGSVDNSVGMVVEMPREKVVDDRNQTCSRGLHVGAPDFVRNYWSQQVIVECIVNPRDVVSVPKDYKNTKMRVCRYQVMGYSAKSQRTNQVVKLSDFIKTPDAEMTEILKAGVENGKELNTSDDAKGKTDKVESVPQPKTIMTVSDAEKQIEGKSAKQIVEHVEKVTGKKITLSLKNKQGIIKKAIEILESSDGLIEAAETTSTDGRKDATTVLEKKVEKGPWAMRVTDVGSNKLAVVKLVKEETTMGLKESKDFVDQGQMHIVVGASKRFAEVLAKKYQDRGCTVEVYKPSDNDKSVTITKKTTKTDLLKMAKKFNETPSSRTKRDDLVVLVTKLYKDAGYTVN